eukprot:gnl/Hemi2/9104_TR3158_c0_g1_i1.p1 gnl/Hemi2/9104_TR3158_c0_g1~~gnl/Hemi2/9104_TR3158_c0_g1_i1.p1  ORF type:complete len:400 (-),score=148.70 gnl/Hemi2/9104_TR3158_c0_g1_i1:218-1375(-)
MAALSLPACPSLSFGGATKRPLFSSEDEDASGWTAVFEELKGDVVACVDTRGGGLGLDAASVARLVYLIDHSLKGGKLMRARLVQESFLDLKQQQSQPVQPQELKLARVLGWCVEWLQAGCLVLDDLMDSSVTRRGLPCWYTLPNTGLMAANDSNILRSCLFFFIRKYFCADLQRLALTDLFLDVNFKTELGQMLDTVPQYAGKDDQSIYSRFTMENFLQVVQLKTAYYSFYLPLALGMVLAGYNPSTASHAAAFAKTQEICLLLGEYFQVQDDYLDCFVDDLHKGKNGTDIQDRKCSWLMVTALRLATPEQKAVLQANYGDKDPAKVATVKALFRTLGLERLYREYEAAMERRFQDAVAAARGVEGVPLGACMLVLQTLSGRDK